MTPSSTQTTPAPGLCAEQTLQALARNAAAVLRQGIALIERLEPRQFSEAPHPEGLPAAARDLFARGAVGAHVRHVLEHYEAFFVGIESESVDYDRRGRDRRVEARRELACERLEACARQLESLHLRASDRNLGVVLGTPEDQRAGNSSLARELQFLSSHTVHHYALIAVLVRLWGVVPDDDFGVAPSTLAYERGAPPCAP